MRGWAGLGGRTRAHAHRDPQASVQQLLRGGQLLACPGGGEHVGVPVCVKEALLQRHAELHGVDGDLEGAHEAAVLALDLVPVVLQQERPHLRASQGRGSAFQRVDSQHGQEGVQGRRGQLTRLSCSSRQ